jgi:hypothetical protein
MTEREIGFLKMFCERVDGRTDRKQGVLARQIRSGEDTENIALAGSLHDQGYLSSDASCAHEDWYLSKKGKEWMGGHR